jgi:hypothetical protein
MFDEFSGLFLGLIRVHRHLPGRYYSEPNGAAIRLGRVDLRVDYGHFGNHMNIQESPRANNPVRRSRIGTGRHGGRPSPEQKANPALPTY